MGARRPTPRYEGVVGGRAARLTRPIGRPETARARRPAPKPRHGPRARRLGRPWRSPTPWARKACWPAEGRSLGAPFGRGLYVGPKARLGRRALASDERAGMRPVPRVAPECVGTWSRYIWAGRRKELRAGGPLSADSYVWKFEERAAWDGWSVRQEGHERKRRRRREKDD